MDFDRAFDVVIGHEGSYSRHPDDPGGETMWGITRRVAMQEGYQGDMRYLSRDTAKAIYLRRYWQALQADSLPDALRLPLFDAAVNSGATQAVKWLQRCVDVVDDGVIGPMTLQAAQRCNAVRVAAAMQGMRLDFMTSLPTWGMFSRGWSRRIAANLMLLVQAPSEPAQPSSRA
ncbi:MAG TPA: glycosyl hydrolase 108 family protein [Ramlibacter sp.]|uniref:glycoside hydrolase family 108 protein n=1 Tax=Ramlibacter sp. TaxID=1917967 RepID=UPI002D80F4A1|nr:glycosyl hydrolase 108 family protein [Ramlibacter sp.]HET8744319.1 glycosyl hydrolase 108 family protein [Ramlibacter sp.]